MVKPRVFRKDALGFFFVKNVEKTGRKRYDARVKVTSESPAQTERIAADLAGRIVASEPRRRAAVVALEGELGAGKTVFVRGFARALGVRRPIKSPTFLIMRQYAARGLVLCHLDCYRITGARELAPLGFRELLEDPRNVVLVEWAERVRRALPRGTVRVHIDHVGPHERAITITP